MGSWGVLTEGANLSEELQAMLIEEREAVDNDDPVTLEYDEPPVLRAAADDNQFQQLETIITAFQSKDQINYQYGDGISALFTACCNGCFKNVKLLLDTGADPNIETKDKVTPLHIAALNGRDNIVRLLLARGANMFVQDSDGKTPLHGAVSCNHCDVVVSLSVFLEESDKKRLFNLSDKFGKTPLHYAVVKNRMKLLETLFFLDLDLNSQDNLGRTPLHLAIKMFSGSEIIKFLVQKGANTDLLDYQGHSPLHYTCLYGHDSAFDYLLSLGVTLTTIDVYKRTAFHLACFSDQPSILSSLLGKQKDMVNYKDNHGITALNLCCLLGRVECFKLLLEAGADLVEDDRGSTPLHAAFFSGDRRMISLLLSEEIDTISSRGSRSKTSQFELLLRKIDLPDHRGRTPLFYLLSRRIKKNLVSEVISKYELNVNKVDEEGLSLLHWVCAWGYYEYISILHSFGVKVNLKDNQGRAPVHLAVANGNLECIATLRNIGADLALTDGRGQTLLHLAARFGKEKSMSELLISISPAELNAVDNKRGRSALHLAAIYGHTYCAAELVSKGIEKETKDRLGKTPLHLAAVSSVDCCLVLISNSCNINIQDNEGNTPLHQSAKSNKEDIISFLISKGADMNIRNQHGKLPLHLAAQYGAINSFSLLIRRNPGGVNEPDGRGMTPMHWAALNGHLNILDIALANSANISLLDHYGRNLLHMASYHHHQAIYDKLHNLGHVTWSNIADAQGRTPLFYALCKDTDDYKFIRSLFKRGANPRHRDNIGNTTVHLAALRSEEMMTVLIDEGAEPGAKNLNDVTPLHLATISGEPKVTWYLLSLSGVDVNARDKAGRTPLHWACFYGNHGLISSLTQGGADVTCVDSTGMSVLHLSALRGHFTCASILLGNPAARPLLRQPRGDGMIPLQVALLQGHDKLAKFLLTRDKESGNHLDSSSRSALHYAAYVGNEELCRVIVENGAQVDQQDSLGMTPLMISAMKGSYLVVQMLLERGADVNLTDRVTGRGPLHWAAARGQLDTLWLISAEVNTRLALDARGMSAAQLARSRGHLECAEWLEKYCNGKKEEEVEVEEKEERKAKEEQEKKLNEEEEREKDEQRKKEEEEKKAREKEEKRKEERLRKEEEDKRRRAQREEEERLAREEEDRRRKEEGKKRREEERRRADEAEEKRQQEEDDRKKSREESEWMRREEERREEERKRTGRVARDDEDKKMEEGRKRRDDGKKKDEKKREAKKKGRKGGEETNYFPYQLIIGGLLVVLISSSIYFYFRSRS